jgi:hypothetical protein
MNVLLNSLGKVTKGLALGVLSICSGVHVFAQSATDTYTTVGSQTWTVPQGVTSITLEAWGAGGGGGGTLSQVLPYSNPRAGGGGGGAYSQVQLTVTPGDVLTIEVGAGGAGGLSNVDGATGGTSFVDIAGSTVISADGGQGGSYRTSADLVGTATGLGGSTGTGFTFAGGNGGPNNNASNGSGGGGAGGSTQAGTDGSDTAAGIGGTVGGGNGGDPTTAGDVNGNAGFAPGGGGGGSRTTANAGSNQGGEGARGEIRITYCVIPAQPDVIVGLDALCEGTVENYSVTNDPNATSYNWVLPADWSGTSTTNTIGAVAGSASGVISVEAINACGTSVPQELTITTTAVPAQPSAITGNTTLCAGTTELYSVDNDPSVDAYVWTFPADWTGASDSNSVELTAGTDAGTITVVAENACGSSPVRIINVSTSDVPAQPSVITGLATVCQGETTTYQVTNDPTVTYAWTFPTDWTGASTTNSISLTVGAASGNVVVTAENQCGTSASQTLGVAVNTINDGVTQSGITLTATQTGAVYQWIDCTSGAPIAGATSQTYTPTQNGEYSVLIFTPENCSVQSDCFTINSVGVENTIFASMKIYPNPASGQLTISDAPGDSEIKIIDLTGKVVFSTVSAPVVEVNVSDINDGVYMIHITNKSGFTTEKLIIKK